MDKLAKSPKSMRQPFRLLALLMLLALFFFTGLGIGSSKDESAASTIPVTTTDTTTTSQTQAESCPVGLDEIKSNGMCQPIIRGLSCNFLTGGSSYTCTVQTYDSQKMFTCTPNDAYAYCF